MRRGAVGLVMVVVMAGLAGLQPVVAEAGAMVVVDFGGGDQVDIPVDGLAEVVVDDDAAGALDRLIVREGRGGLWVRLRRDDDAGDGTLRGRARVYDAAGIRAKGPVTAVDAGSDRDVVRLAVEMFDRRSRSDVTFTLTVPRPVPLPCGSGGDTTAGTHARSFTTAAGLERSYLFTMPLGYTPGVPTDVVFNFHGLGSNAGQQLPYSDLAVRAERDTVIVVTPDGQRIPGSTGNNRFWSLGTDAGDNVDVDFVYELIAALETGYCLDEFFATGMSMGGGMTTVLACRADSPFEAFVPVTLVFYSAPGCGDAPPRPIIELHGALDGIVSYATIPATMAAWAAHNGCDPDPVDEEVGDQVTRRRWTGCAATTELYTVADGGHEWFGSPFAPPRAVSASDVAWSLFF